MTLDPLLVYIVAAALLGLVVGLVIGRLGRNALAREIAARDAELTHRASVEAEREHALALASERLSSIFGQLADRHFETHTATFLQLARESLSAHTERAKGDLAAREQAIESLVKPIRDALARTETQLLELDRARRETHGSIAAQLEAMTAAQQALSMETRNLVKALRRPEVRGQWGEITLRRLVELAGMVEHCDFVSQATLATENGVQRPDMIIRLPEGRTLVVDVKTPLDAYLEATEAGSDAERSAALQRHAAIVAGRVRELALKAYWSQFETSPEFVVLFIPGDQFLSAALAERPALLDEALRQNVILATPTSLVALLKAIAYGWQQVALAENAAEIRSLAVQLYERLTSFTGHLNTLGKALSDSVKAFNSGVGSLERMVLPAARRFTDLGVQPRQRLATVRAVEDTVRDPAANEIVESAEPVERAEPGPAAIRSADGVS